MNAINNFIDHQIMICEETLRRMDLENSGNEAYLYVCGRKEAFEELRRYITNLFKTESQ